jgi:hypothetical protein
MEDIRKKIVEMPENLPEVPKDMFQYAQKDEVLYDANPETISRGFFKDALVRLKKNRASIAAFWILCFIIFMAIFGPGMNEYNFSQQFPDYTNMPPRVQFLENFALQLVVLLAAGIQLVAQILAFYMPQHIIDGGDAHFDTGVAFPQKLYGIVFYHSFCLLSCHAVSMPREQYFILFFSNQIFVAKMKQMEYTD